MPLPSHLRQHGAMAVLLVALAAIYLPWSWSEELGDLGGDSAVYMLTARHFAPYLPHDPVNQAMADSSQFPPLYPALLAATGGAVDLPLAHAVTVLCLLLALAAFYACLLTLGLSRVLALVTVALFAAMPGTYLQALQLKSEALYLALSLAGLAFLAPAGESGRTATFWWATGLLGAALITRSAGVALLPALFIVLLRQRPRGWYWMPVVMLLPAVIWSVLHRSPESYTDSLLAYGYAAAPITTIARQIAVNAEALVLGVAGNVVQTRAVLLGLTPFLLVAVIVLAYRFWKRYPDAWYVMAYLAIILIWPYPSEAQRFAWVIMPWLLGYAVWIMELVAAKIRTSAPPPRIAIRWALPVALALLVAPSVLLAVQRRMDPAVQEQPVLAHLPEWYEAHAIAARERAEAHLDLVDALTSLGPEIPEGQCVYAIKSATATYYTGRDSFAPPYEKLDDATFERLLGSGPCRYFLMIAATDGAVFRTPYYPRDRLGPRLQLLDVRASRRDPRHPVVAALARLNP